METRVELSEAQLDALKEVGNIGAAHASAALEQLISQRVTITVPRAYVLPIEKIPKVLGKEDDIIIGLFFRIFGEVQGSILVTFSEEQAMFFANTLLGGDNSEQKMTEEKGSALKELGNILASSYLTAMSTLMGFNLMPSTPYISHDMAAAVVDPLIIDLSKTVDYALIIDTEFVLSTRVIAGKFLTFFDRRSFTSILEALGMQDK